MAPSRFTRFILSLGVALGAASSALAQTAAPLGVTLSGVSYYTPEQPFLNIFKTGSWITQVSGGAWDTNEEGKVALDANGYPPCLCGAGGQAITFNQISTLLVRRLDPALYPGGQYVVLYDGQGTLTYSFDAVKDTSLSAPGRDVITVTPSGGGILLSITATDPNHTGNYIRNIRVVPAQYESLLSGGEMFNPAFVDIIRPFGTLRFMEWMQTNGSTEGASWAARLTPDSAFWTDGLNNSRNTASVPVEVMVRLANKLGANAWFTIPHLATDNYVTQFATLVHQQLGGTQNVYVEYSNETWNSQFSQTTWMQQQGLALWPLAPSFDANRSYYGMRVAQICDIWKSVWGADGNRVECVMAAQAANTYTATQSLACPLWSAGAPCSGRGLGAIAIAPYFGGNVSQDIMNAAILAVVGNNNVSYWQLSTGQQSAVDTYIQNNFTIQDVLARAEASINPQTGAWTAAYKTVANQYGLPLVGYEGGQSLVGYLGNENSVPLTAILTGANRDPGMGTLTTAFLQAWQQNGGGLMNYYADISGFSKWGSWGALESVMNSSSPKYDALLEYIGAPPIGSQAIVFTSPPPAVAVVDGPGYTPSATGGGSGNPVVFSIDPPALGVCGIVEGVVTFTGAGTCVIDANQAGNAAYRAALQVQQSFTVGKGATTTALTSDLSGETTVGQGYTVSGTVAPTGSLLTAPTGSVGVSDGSASCTATLSAGTFTCSLTSTSAGAKTITATYPGSADFTRSSATAAHVVRLASVLTYTGTTSSKPGDTITLSATLKTSGGIAIASRTVSFGLNGASVTATTNSSGVAAKSTTAPTTPDTYPLTVGFVGDATYAAASASASLADRLSTTLAYSGATSATAGATTTLAATLKTRTGVLLAGKTVRFTLGGMTYTATTNSSGVATAAALAPASAGSFTIGVGFAGDNADAPSSTSATLKVRIRTVIAYTGLTSTTRGTPTTLSATRTTGSGTPLSGQTLKFTLTGHSSTATTNTSGMATATAAAATSATRFSSGGGAWCPWTSPTWCRAPIWRRTSSSIPATPCTSPLPWRARCTSSAR